MLLAAILIFRIYERQLSTLWFDMALNPEVAAILEEAGESLKDLSRYEPENREFYRQRFQDIQQYRQNLTIISHNREDLIARFEQALAGVIGLILLAAIVFHIMSMQRTNVRLERLRGPLALLAAGRSDIQIDDTRNDLLGRMGRMIEQTSRVMAKQEERIRYLDHLGEWQEASRRHAHEIKTPLTAARMEVERLLDLDLSDKPKQEKKIFHVAESILEELDSLKRFTDEFTAFAKMRKPAPQTIDLNPYMENYASLFAKSWDNLTLHCQLSPTSVEVNVDKEMLRQVLVNLCNNSSLALNDRKGEIFLKTLKEEDEAVIEIRDTGPGVPQHMVARLFEPYTTTREIGKGMGLGLPIARKIMLDHGGELELHANSEQGAVFRLRLPLQPETITAETMEKA
jgi:nitrogen fixation/metabolism regulation signal transduction histidine kinase